MGERLVVAGHEAAESVLAAYRAERDAVRRSHLQVIWLLLSGEGLATVARVSGFTPRWVRALIRRWNESGRAGLGDRRRGNAGAARLLDDAGLAALAAALEGAPEDGGLWSGRKVAAWMSGYLGRPVSPKRGLDYLHRLGFSLQRPRPRHVRSASAEERAAYKKNSAARWRAPRPRIPGARSSCGPSTNTGSA
jgi:transposase